MAVILGYSYKTGEYHLHDISCPKIAKQIKNGSIELTGEFANEATAQLVYEENNEAGTTIHNCVPSKLKIGS